MSYGLIVADESVDFRIISALRSLDCEVYAICEQSPSITDIQVLEKAVAMNALLITEDKDFGELVFRLQLPHKGVLLIRVIQLPVEEKLKLISEAIVRNLDELVGSFSVLSGNAIRIKKRPLGE